MALIFSNGSCIWDDQFLLELFNGTPFNFNIVVNSCCQPFTGHGWVKYLEDTHNLLVWGGFSWPILSWFWPSRNSELNTHYLLDVIAPCISLLRSPADADSLYIAKFCKENDIRLLFGAQGSTLAYGSRNEEGDGYNDAMYHNVNDLVGFGLTYKWIDFDLSFSLPDSKILE